MNPSDLEYLLRDLAPQVLGALLRRYRDFSAAEDAVQDSLLAAAVKPKRRWRTGYILPAHDPVSGADYDDTLVLVNICCHPSLTPSSAIALTLRAVGGLTASEIARAFLVPESTMAQRISRAKQTIKDSGVPFQLPPRDSRAVLHVLYLIFNEGYSANLTFAVQACISPFFGL